MLDQSLIQSGFDAEILLGETQLKAILLALVDAGTIRRFVGSGSLGLELGGPAVVDRTYVPDPATPGLPPVSDTRHPFQVEILFDDPTGADIRVHAVVEVIEVDLFVKLDPIIERDDADLVVSAKLGITVVEIKSGAIDSEGKLLGTPKTEIISDINAKLGNPVDLGGFGAFNRIQDIAIRKHRADAEHQAAYGIYVNLRLQIGPEPESLMPTRGNTDDALNFLPAGSDAAYASRSGIYPDLANDAFNRFAEIDDNGVVTHPWHKSPFKKTSKIVGTIKGVTVAPLPNSTTLQIKVDAEREVENFFNPNGTLVIELTPITTSEGTLKWRTNVDFQGSVLLEILGFITIAAIFTGVFAVAGLAVAPAIAAGFMTGSGVDFLGHRIIDEWRSGRIEKKVDAGLPDVISGRVNVAQRRWDPFYTTLHQIATRPDGALVNGNGIALWGRAILDRETAPVPHAVIRDKERQGISPPTHLLYSIHDAEDFKDDYDLNSPGTDRRHFEQPDKVGQPTIFRLSIEEIVARIAEGRIVPDIAYVAKRIDLRQNQVHSILVLSREEYNETRAGVIAAFEAKTREEVTANETAEFRGEAETELAGLGLTPVPGQIDAMVQERIDERVAELVDAFTEGPTIDGEVEQAVLPLLKFDLPPENLAALEKKRILHLLGLEIITMHAPGHQGFMYYRDHPNFDERDNLHSLPRYRETPNGPELL